MFNPNRKFRRQYDRLFKKEPETANFFLLLCEIADEKGQVMTNEKELAVLMVVRFEDPTKHAFKGGTHG